MRTNNAYLFLIGAGIVVGVGLILFPINESETVNLVAFDIVTVLV